MTTDDDSISYGIPLTGVHDGVSVWVHKDGTVRNRWRGEGGRRERLTDEWISKHKPVPQ